MAIEEEFGIELPEADAPNLAILGNMHDCIVSLLQQKGDTPNEEQIWQRLSAVVIKQLGVRPNEVTHTAHMVYDLGAD